MFPKETFLTFGLLARVTKETPKALQAVAIALGCLLELEGNTLLLQRPHTQDQDVEGVGWTDLKASSLAPNLIESDDPMQVAKRGKQPLVLSVQL